MGELAKKALQRRRQGFPQRGNEILPTQTKKPEGKKEGLVDEPIKGREDMVVESSASVAFQLNLNPGVGLIADNRTDFYPSGRTIRYRSPLFGELEAQVLVDKGAVVWCWHPLRECETAIPKEWILGLSEEP